MIGKSLHKLELQFPSFVVLGSTVVQKNPLVLHLSSGYVSGFLSLVDLITCIVICMCSIVVFINFSRCCFINPPVRPGQVLRKLSSIDLGRLVVVGLKSAS